MRSQNRQEAGVLAAGTATFLFDADGADTFTITVENNDQKAALSMRTGGNSTGSATPATRASAFRTHGSKNGNLKFEAVAAGTTGNNNTIEITAAASQAFSIDDLGSDDYRINLKCDASGKPIQTAYEVLIAIAGLVSAGASAYRAAINTTLAAGSDGSATMEVLASDATHVIPASTALAGGSAATTTVSGTVKLSPQSIADGGSFGANVSSTDLDAVATGTPKSTFVVDKTAKGVKVEVVVGGTGTWLACTMLKK